MEKSIFYKNITIRIQNVHWENLGLQNILDTCGQQTTALQLLRRKFEHNPTQR